MFKHWRPLSILNGREFQASFRGQLDIKPTPLWDVMIPFLRTLRKRILPPLRLITVFIT